MAIEKEIVINVDTSKADSNLEKTTGIFSKFAKGASDFAKDIKEVYADAEKEIIANEKAVEKQGKGFKALSVISGGVSSTFKGMGTALKGIGIGIVVALVAKLSDAFKGNQKVTDALNIAFSAISIILQKVVGTFLDMFNEVSELTGGFDALRKVLGGALTVAINTIVIAFQSLFLGVKKAQLAWEDSFLGGGDEGKIASLTKEIDGLETKIGETADKIKAGGKDIANNFSEALGEIGSLAEGVVNATAKAVNEIDLSSAIAGAKLLERNKKNFELLALQQARLQLQFQADAEKLRQIRDDDSKAIKERIKANDELALVLKNQFKAEASTINLRIAGLQNEQKLLGVTVERQNEIFQLQTDLIDLNERLLGQESEQLTNRNGLLREEIDLKKTLTEGEKERAKSTKEFNESLEKDEIIKLEKQRERLEEENNIIAEDLEAKRLLYAEGTQSRVDAENDYLNKKLEIDQALILNAEATSNKEKELAEAVSSAKINIASQTIGLINEVAGEGAKIGKGLALAQATISGIEGVQNAFTTASKSPITALSPAYPFIQAGLAGAFSLTQIAKIASTNPSKGGGGSAVGGGGGGQAPQAPSFNLVEGTGRNQIAESLSRQAPLKAFVVSNDVTSGQSMDRNIIESSRL